MNYFSRIMGAPEEREWPDVPLPWSSFKNYKKQPLESVIPDIGPQELDLLEVRNSPLSIHLKKTVLIRRHGRVFIDRASVKPWF